MLIMPDTAITDTTAESLEWISTMDHLKLGDTTNLDDCIVSLFLFMISLSSILPELT